MDLDTYLKETFCVPLGLKRITYEPLEHGFAPDDCAATELNGNTRDGAVSFDGIRTYTIQGEVHDENAYYCMGGVSGHAGLFASSTDLARLADLMLSGTAGDKEYFSQEVIDLFTSKKSDSEKTGDLAGGGREISKEQNISVLRRGRVPLATRAGPEHLS